MVLSELNKTDVAELGALFARDRQVTVHLMDGYQALKAQLPPPERRGLVLVDSSFDRAGELRRVADALALAHERWATGILALWYPLLEPAAMRGFERDVVATGIRKILQLELAVRPEGWTADVARLRDAGRQPAVPVRSGGGGDRRVACEGARDGRRLSRAVARAGVTISSGQADGRCPA